MDYFQTKLWTSLLRTVDQNRFHGDPGDCVHNFADFYNRACNKVPFDDNNTMMQLFRIH